MSGDVSRTPGAERPEEMKLHENAHYLTVFRPLPDGTGRQYTATTWDEPWQGCNSLFRQARYVGYVRPSHSTRCGCYAVLDVLDEGLDIVQDWCIPTAEAHRWWYSKLGLRVDAGVTDVR